MKAKLVIENIKFERGISPVRGLDIGRYKDIYKDIIRKEIEIPKSIERLGILATYFQFIGGKLKPSKKLFKVINHYRKDPYHTDQVDFVYDWIRDIAMANRKFPDEKEFLETAYDYTQNVDYQIITLIDTIAGLYHAVKSNLEIFMK